MDALGTGQGLTPEQQQQAAVAQQAALSQLMLLQQRSLDVVHLDHAVSVNLAAIASYEEVELMDEKTVGEGKSAKVEQVSFDPPRLVPVLYFADGREIQLTEDETDADGNVVTVGQNTVFRAAWQRHAKLSVIANSILDQLFPDDMIEEVVPPTGDNAVAGSEGGVQ